MKFIDLQQQYLQHKKEIDNRIKEVLNHGRFIKGPEIEELEQKLAHYVGAKQCITVASGTDALLIALMALDIQPNDEIITSPFSFFATAEVIFLLGAKPVFVDIDPKTYIMDARLIEAAITPKTKAIMPVSLFGQCADMDTINALAAKYNIAVIEDAAQSFGATYKDNFSCHLSTIGCTSFYPSKPLGCYGDGGACFTDDASLAKKMRLIRDHGQDYTYHHVTLGINGRLDTLQAAVLLAKLNLLTLENELRSAVAGHYAGLLEGYVNIPYIEPYNTMVYAQYTIGTPNRALLQRFLESKGIPTAIHYPLPLYKQPIFQRLMPDMEPLPWVEKACDQVLSLPMHPYLSDAQIATIAAKILEFTQQKEDIEILKL